MLARMNEGVSNETVRDETVTDEILLDGGPRGAAAERDRLCVATRTIRPTSSMIRFVAGPDGKVVPDVKRKLPGRGAWVTAARGPLVTAVKQGAFKRAFKGKATVDPGLVAETERLLARAVLDALAIAHKSGTVVAGYTKVEAALSSGRPVGLVRARDASPDGARKMDAAAARRPGASDRAIPVICSFESAELDLALGRANVIHAALLPGRASEAVLGRWRMLEMFRTSDPEPRGDRQTAAEPARD
ncbi:RNA-binding protein [Rhodoplanes roseus]|uniref:DNA-binding protein n=1 Tax=Rhodoplanes roseus TaxID=29409 RepID=A0A327KZT8_9BRAD|nr:RNA-binding protein [Rhodoplanes roseus]RAI43706.1 DNA-binding protein [Rhodoplanes roseus]